MKHCCFRGGRLSTRPPKRLAVRGAVDGQPTGISHGPPNRDLHLQSRNDFSREMLSKWRQSCGKPFCFDDYYFLFFSPTISHSVLGCVLPLKEAALRQNHPAFSVRCYPCLCRSLLPRNVFYFDRFKSEVVINRTGRSGKNRRDFINYTRSNLSARAHTHTNTHTHIHTHKCAQTHTHKHTDIHTRTCRTQCTHHTRISPPPPPPSLSLSPSPSLSSSLPPLSLTHTHLLAENGRVLALSGNFPSIR